MMQYNKLSDHLQRRFGCKVYKLALEGGMTCPNRDGTLDTRGCIFCGADGSGAFAQTGETVFAQIEAAKARVSAKIKDGKYIAYFQNFTNTYGSAEHLAALFRAALSHPDVAALSIATRPDCLPEPVLDLLAELNRTKPVWVELGLQTIHPDTARYIRRGYDLPVYEQAVEALHARGIEVITHVILYLPRETREQMLETVRYVGRHTDGIKLQLLHVLRGTDLEKDYIAGNVPLPDPEAYCRLICDCLRVLPPEVVIHRLTGDGAKKDLIAPLWTGDKKRVLNTLNRILEEEQIVQGSGLYPIHLSPHQPFWKDWYAGEAARVLDILQDIPVIRINHVGSTSITGIHAKPIIDLMAELPTEQELSRAEAVLLGQGYTPIHREAGWAVLGKGYTKTGYAKQVFHLHLRLDGNHDELYFRDYLNENPGIAQQYQQLKLQLSQSFPYDRNRYTDAKTEFVKIHTAAAKQKYGPRYETG